MYLLKLKILDSRHNFFLIEITHSCMKMTLVAIL